MSAQVGSELPVDDVHTAQLYFEVSAAVLSCQHSCEVMSAQLNSEVCYEFGPCSPAPQYVTVTLTGLGCAGGGPGHAGFGNMGYAVLPLVDVMAVEEETTFRIQVFNSLVSVARTTEDYGWLVVTVRAQRCAAT